MTIAWGIASVLMVLILVPLLFFSATLRSSGSAKAIFSQKWVKYALGIGFILILYYLWGDFVLEKLDLERRFSEFPWWGWLLGVIALGLFIGRKSDPFGAVIATGMVAIVLAVVVFVLLVIADIFGWLDKFAEMNNSSLPAVCTMKAQKEQQDSLIRHGPGSYIDKVGRNIVVCRNQKGKLTFLTKNGAPVTVTIAKHFERDYGHLMPGVNDELRLAQFIGITYPRSPGNGAEGWGIYPKLMRDKYGKNPPFYVQDLDYVIIHVKLAQ